MGTCYDHSVQNSPRSLPTSRSGEVLIVDADAPIRGLLATVVKRVPRRPVVAVDERRAIELLSNSVFDAVILELMLAGRAGFEVLSHIDKTQPELLRRVVIVTTETKLDSETGALASVAAILRKPFAVDELQRVLRACCEPSAAAG